MFLPATFTGKYCLPVLMSNVQLLQKVYIIELSEGEKITIYFIDRIRDERKFESLDYLKEQLIRDKETVLKIVRNK